MMVEREGEREKMIYERKMKRSEKYIDIEEFKREMIQERKEN